MGFSSDFLDSEIGRSLEWGLWEDLLKSNVIYYNIPLGSYNDVLTAVSGTGATALDPEGFNFRTGDTSGSEAIMEIQNRESGTEDVEPKLTWDRRKLWKTVAYIETASAQEASIVMGRAGWGGDWTTEHVGFYILNDEFHMSVADGATHNHSLATTFAAGTAHRFRAKLIPGDRAIFWIDGTKQGELTSNLPSGTHTKGKFLSGYITNTEAADKGINTISEVTYLQLES